MLDVAREERWIDFMPHEKKRSGAYSAGTYDSKPFILTNFTGEYDSLSTLAHEFGHSMHSYYSHKHNRAMLAEYRIFVAEVASTVNELLLNDYLLKHSDNNDHKAYLLSNLLNQMIGTMYRQTMYATFEYQLYEAIEKEKHCPQKMYVICMSSLIKTILVTVSLWMIYSVTAVIMFLISIITSMCTNTL